MCGARRTSLAGLESLVGKPEEAGDIAVKPCVAITAEGRKVSQDHGAAGSDSEKQVNNNPAKVS